MPRLYGNKPSYVRSRLVQGMHKVLKLCWWVPEMLEKLQWKKTLVILKAQKLLGILKITNIWLMKQPTML